MLVFFLFIFYVCMIFLTYTCGSVYETVLSTDEDYEWKMGLHGMSKFRMIDSKRKWCFIISLFWLIVLPIMGIYYGIKLTLKKIDVFAEDMKEIVKNWKR